MSLPTDESTEQKTGLLPPDDRWSSSVIRDLLAQARRPDVLSLAGGLPAEELIPQERVQNAMNQVVTIWGAQCLQYGLTAGEPVLAEAIAARSPRPGASPDNILITAGSQQALDLIARAFSVVTDDVAPIVAIEDPGYLGAVQVLRANGYQLVGIPVDADGIQVDVLAERLAGGLRPRLVYVNPSFQNPTGACLSQARAARLVELAERYGFLLIADDPYVELYLSGDRPLPLPASANVAYLGSTSKVIAPGLRIGWLDAAPDIVGRVALAKQAADLQTATFNQLLVAEVLSDSRWWDAHLAGLRAGYRMRRDALANAISTHLPTATVTPQRGGFFFWVALDRPVDVRSLLTAALDSGVAFVPGDAFAVDTPLTGTIRLSYSNGDPLTYDEALRRLALAYARL
ncbi:MAG: PLP-dependent aminotransferase family protein [Acidimicrobiales bacterium]